MNASPSVCSAFRNEENFRRFFALMSWLLKFFTIVVFLATIRLHNQQVQQEQEEGHQQEPDADAPRHRRVTYRHLNQHEQNNSNFQTDH